MKPVPRDPEPPVYAENARDVLLASKADLIRQIATLSMMLGTARAALQVIADGDGDTACRDYARSQWALTDPTRRQTALAPARGAGGAT